MARVTQAQQIQIDNELRALAYFERTLGALPDPRRAEGIRYPLRTVVVTALMAMICGCDDAEAMELWGETNSEWLQGFLELPHGAPTQDVFLTVFGALDPEAFHAVFRAWAELLTLRLEPESRHIAIDGKTSRRSFDAAAGRPAIHTVSAWLTEAGLVLGQRKTEDKSNEITAIPELLRTLDIKGATITIDVSGLPDRNRIDHHCRRWELRALREGEPAHPAPLRADEPWSGPNRLSAQRAETSTAGRLAHSAPRLRAAQSSRGAARYGPSRPAIAQSTALRPRLSFESVPHRYEKQRELAC